MGVAQQKEAVLFYTEALASATPPDADTFLQKARQHERLLCGGSELSGVAEPVAVAVVEAANASQHHGQLRWLLRLCTRLLRAATENQSEPIDAAAPAVVHITELLLRHVLRLTKGQSVVLIGVLEAGEPDGEDAAAAPSSSNALVREDAAAQLCAAAFALLIHIAPSQHTVPLHCEVLGLLLTMTSTALHHSTEFREDTMDLFTELMMSSPHLEGFLATLLKIIVAWGTSDWEAQAPLLYHEGCQPSMRNFFQVFGGGPSNAASESKKKTVPYVVEVEAGATAATSSASAQGSTSTAGAAGAPVLKDPSAVLLGSCSCWEQLGRHAAALFCVLVVHQKGGGRNPALDYAVSLRDGSPVSFVRLLSAIRWKVTRCPEVAILLYVLLHDHHEFLHTVLSEDAALLVSTMQQLLELTYKTCKDASRPAVASRSGEDAFPGTASAQPVEDVLQTAVLGRLVYHLRTFSYPFINFMSSTLLLLISQDCVVNRLLCNTPCLPGHLLERYDANAPVGALALVVLALGITKGFNERNEALIAVFAPCLVNMAPFVHDMDPYTAQRVAGLLTLVLKKIHRAGALLLRAAAAARDAGQSSDADETQPRSSPSSSRPSVVAGADEAHALEEIMAMYLRQLRTVIEGIEALLRGANRRNEHLVYELLYARRNIIDDVEAAETANSPHAAATKQMLTNLVAMVKSCEADIASSDQAQSPQEIIAILRRGQRQGCGGSGGGEDGAEGVSHNNAGGGAGQNGSANGPREVEMTNIGAPTAAAAAAGASPSPAQEGNGLDGASVDLVYSYEESPHSYDFFGPFVWSILLSAARGPGGALWCHRSSELALFPH